MSEIAQAYEVYPSLAALRDSGACDGNTIGALHLRGAGQIYGSWLGRPLEKRDASRVADYLAYWQGYMGGALSGGFAGDLRSASPESRVVDARLFLGTAWNRATAVTVELFIAVTPSPRLLQVQVRCTQDDQIMAMSALNVADQPEVATLADALALSRPTASVFK